MKSRSFFVVDTNCFISANLLETSVSARAFDHALQLGHLAISEPLLSEYTEVLYRKKLDKYLSEQKRKRILQRFINHSIRFFPSELVNDCRDPKDNMVLELALACNAAFVLSGDKDLLVLHPYRNIPILSASQFLESSV
ncbi:hypothetical protein GCM10023231_11280 [Olivibacter ginsenosidimutans]|uniref:PIN domain-containing protein n=1 Tax=Olivibacter ginsenosidimutans TaxID=1176537 RepID=A0ABP9ARF4_9SPHI